MVSYAVYRLIHLIGIILLFTALGGMTLQAVNGGGREKTPARTLASITHGIGLLLVLLGGFGQLARLELNSPADWPGWVWGKVVLWLVLGGIIAMVGRKPDQARLMFLIVPLLGILAAYLAIFQPF